MSITPGYNRQGVTMLTSMTRINGTVKRIFITGLLLLSVMVRADEAPMVVASIKPLALITQALLKDTGIQTEILLPPSISEHSYALKISDVEMLGNARLVIWIDEDLEPYLASTRQQWLAREKPEKSLVLLPLLPMGKGSSHTHADPHIWLDPDIAREMAVHISTRLAVVFPEEKNRIEKNREAFDEEVARLDDLLAASLFPYKNSPFLVFHDAYSYWTQHYHLQQIGALLDSNGSMKGLGRQAQLQKAVEQQQQAVCLFSEPQLSAKAPSFGATFKIKKGVLDPLGIDARSYSELMQDLSNQAVACFKRH